MIRSNSSLKILLLARLPLRRALLSTAPNAASAASSTTVSQYPNVQTLFDKITAKCSAEDIPHIATAIGVILGKPMTLGKNEFYYKGFGVARAGGAATEEETVAVQETVRKVVDLKLVGFDAAAKIKVIKEIRSIAGLGLKEAKVRLLVDGVG
jgi:large subunit ribosomal protein L7/L12